MSRFHFRLILIIIVFISQVVHSQDIITYGHFGQISIYRPEGIPTSVALFVSGDGGWNSGVVEMAKYVVRQGALVAGIDITHYLKSLSSLSSGCYYPASDFEQLSMLIQKKYKLAQYLKPILIGYSSGATLVYGILAQAPANTFKGAISLGFSADLDVNKPLCTGSGLKQHVLKEGKSYFLEAMEKLTAPFIVLHGTQDQVCSYDETEQYMKNISTGELVELPKVGHGFSKAVNWLPQFITAYKKILVAPSYAEQKNAQNELLKSQHLTPYPGDIPITILPSAISDTLSMAFFISGDGGWTSFDHSICESLANRGISVIGLDAQKYFWNAKTPEEAAQEISKVIQHYMVQWKKKNIILAGYSFGACVIPFIADRLPDALKLSVRGVCCLSPSEKADFEIHISDMLNIDNSGDTYNVPKEIKKIIHLNPVCVFGEEEESDLRKVFSETGAEILQVPGNHHYNNDPDKVALEIYNQLDKKKKYPATKAN